MRCIPSFPSSGLGTIFISKLLLGESQVDLGFAGFWTKPEFCDKKVPKLELGSRFNRPLAWAVAA